MKYFVIAAALIASLAVVDFAEARGRRGCSNCSAGGCAGGVCDVKQAPAPIQKASVEAPKADAAVAAAPAPVSQNTRVASYRRFGRRR
jgi:hypothetical protein